jgi:hypothetical protein
MAYHQGGVARVHAGILNMLADDMHDQTALDRDSVHLDLLGFGDKLGDDHRVLCALPQPTIVSAARTRGPLALARSHAPGETAAAWLRYVARSLRVYTTFMAAPESTYDGRTSTG